MYTNLCVHTMKPKICNVDRLSYAKRGIWNKVAIDA